MKQGGFGMRTLVRWNPYQELTNWHRDIDDLFHRFFPADDNETAVSSSNSWLPAMEAFQKNGEYVIRADVPGISPNDIEVSVLNDALTLRGERKREKEVNEKEYHYSETSYGRFERTLPLPKGVDPEKVKARFENGVLEVSMPLPQSATSKKVPIEGGASQAKQIKAA
jgi:HSP20 family protein